MRPTLFAPCVAIALVMSAAPALAATPAEEANRKLVLDFNRIVLEAHHVDRAEEFLAEGYVQHNPNVPGGLKGFTDAFNRIFASSLNRPIPPETQNPPVATAAEGDMVWLMFRRPRPEPSDPTKTYDSFWFDVFRVQGGKIIEHWDGAIKGSPPPP